MRTLFRDPLVWGAGLLWTVVAALCVVRSAGITMDDFYITFRYAQNLAAGHGFVFNPGERVFGTTAPGLGLLLAALHRLTGIAIPWLGTASTGAALVTAALVILAEMRHRWPEALLGGSLLVTSGYVWLHNGAELPVTLALLALAAACGERRPVAAGILAAFATWCRPDAGLAVGLLGLLLWRERRSWRAVPWRYGWTAATGIALGLGAAWWWFGRPLPATLGVKRFQAEWLPEVWKGGREFWPAALRYFESWAAGEALVFFVLLGLAGQAVLLARGGRVLRLLSLYAMALTLAYPLLGVAFYPWYAEATLIALLYGVAFALGAAGRAVAAFFGSTLPARAMAATLAVLAAVAVLAPMASFNYRLYDGAHYNRRLHFYRQAGLWLGENSAPGEAVAYVEIGILAYFSQRPVRDLLGLVNPESLERLREGGTVAAFLEAPTPFVIYDSRLHRFMEPLRQQPWFDEGYEEVARFEDEGLKEELIIYRRRPGLSSGVPGDLSTSR